MAPPTLLGPPSLRDPTPPPAPAAPTAPTVDPFVGLMVANFNKIGDRPPMNTPMGFTENASPTFLASGNPCVDFFFHIVPNTPAESLTQRLQLAWAHNDLTTLKLVCNLRGVRGTGKSDKEGFYTAAFWLHENHPKTFACNVDSFANFGYFKDIPELLYRLLEGSDVRKIQKAEWEQRKLEDGKLRGWRGCGINVEHPMLFGHGNLQRKNKEKVRRVEPKVPKKVRILNDTEKNRIGKEKATALRKEKKASMAKKVIERYTRDPDFRFLHERVSDLFAQCLKADMQHLNSGQIRKVGLAAKWCPSLCSSFDRSTLLCESIARKVFPRENNPEYEGVEEEHYVYTVRNRLRKEVLVPLRKVLELPEVYIGANRWDAIPYNRVASVAMKLYKEKFLKHDPERFKKYLEDVKAGEKKITAGALLPHEIIGALNNADSGEVAELQWKRMVDDLLKKGKLTNCMAICDVSGSMMGDPMEVSVALGVLVSELSSEPWKGKLITFSANPQLQTVQGKDLKAKTSFVRRMEWGMNTNFQRVFDLILDVAVSGNLKPEQMIKRLFVFSDMEFDQASRNPWETDYRVIVRKFTEKGYGAAIPQIVFWNLRDSRATPVTATQNGVAMVSGFSKNLLKVFLDNDGEINPESIMQEAISGEEYQKLVVID
ncbi:hypothetical protein SLE2022_233180 [Rubroshorea leprosula]